MKEPEYSGVSEVSNSLRNRIYVAMTRHVTEQSVYYRTHVIESALSHEMYMKFLERDLSEIIGGRDYRDVFDAVEIYLRLGKNTDAYRLKILPDLQRAFSNSGSVYFVDSEGQVQLMPDKQLAEKVEETKEMLKEHKSSYSTFLEAVGGLFQRTKDSHDVIKDVFISFEGYLKAVTSKASYSECVRHLFSEKIISVNQKGIFEKIFAYRSDSDGVSHAGNSPKPNEMDALWFIETVIAQMKLIGSKTKRA